MDKFKISYCKHLCKSSVFTRGIRVAPEQFKQFRQFCDSVPSTYIFMNSDHLRIVDNYVFLTLTQTKKFCEMFKLDIKQNHNTYLIISK